MKIRYYLKSWSLITVSPILIILAVSGCATGINSPVTQTTSTSSPTVFHIIGDVNFVVDVPVIVDASQLDSLSIVGTFVLRLKDGSYRMYLQSRDQANNVDIVSLYSSDGLKWLIDPGIRIQHGNVGDIDTEAGEPDAYVGLNGKYYMAYTGRQTVVSTNQLRHKIVFAVSDDSLVWTKLGISYSDSHNRNDFAASADVIRTGDSFIMYYTGGMNIIYATSTDGLNWNRENVLFSAGHDSTTVYLNGFYYMFAKIPAGFKYAANSEPSEDDDLLMAISSDGINWSSGVYRVVVKRGDNTEVSNPDLDDPAAIILEDGSLHLYLNSNGGQSIFSIKPVSALPGPS
jgi:predicted GH43/DUF377 family glycosyl hydrolase